MLLQHAEELVPAKVDRLGGTPLSEATEAVQAAGLYELSALKAAGKEMPGDSLRSLDRQWWVTFKRRYYGYDRLFPGTFRCPVEFKGKAAVMVHEGGLSEAGFKNTALAAIDRAAAAWVKEVGIGFNLCVVRHGVIVVNKGYGTRGVGPHMMETYSADTTGPLASTTKFLSSVLLAEFVDQGLVDFDRPAANYIRALKGPAPPVVPTLRDMYIHIAGLSGHWGDMLPDMEERLADLYRQLEFLAAHQAQLTSDLAELKSIVAMQSQQIAKHDEQIVRNDEQIAGLREAVGIQGGQVQSLADTVLRLARFMDERDRQTDARINALIGVVERYFSNGKK